MSGHFFTNKKRRKNNTYELIPKNKDKLEYVPEVISVKIMSVYDMNKIHGFAMNFFSNEEKRIPALVKKLEYQNNLIGSHQTLVERRDTLDKIKLLDDEISSISSSSKKEAYLNEIAPRMKKFKEISESLDKKIFGEEDNEVECEELTKYMLFIIEIIKKYTSISFDIELLSKFCCVECSFDLTDVAPEHDGIIRCPECRVENEANRCPKKFVSITKNISTSHGDYSERANFYKFIRRIQGKHGETIDKSIYAKLDTYFIKERKDIGGTIRERAFDSKKFKVGTNLDMMLKALNSCGFPEHYDDVYLICRDYWGWELPDFGNDEDEIMRIYDITQTAYIKIENKTRSSSISIPFRAFKIVELLGYPYEVCDFKIPKDDKSREETDKYWRMSCQTCGDNSVYYIPTRRY